MVQIFGSIEQSRTENGTQITTFRIPAVSKTIARQRAKANARIKGLSNFDVDSVQVAGEGQVPGVSFYDVRITSDR